MTNQTFFILFGILLAISGAKAQSFNWNSLNNPNMTTNSYNSRPYRDVHNHAYKHAENLWKDVDRDGYTGYYDFNDRNPAVTTMPNYSSAPSYTMPSFQAPQNTRTIYTGPRGGRYYYNSKGKKVYVRPD